MYSIRRVNYTYDDRGFRLTKTNYKTNETTWYIRDAGGNILYVYEQTNGGTPFRSEVPVYGAGKLGTLYPQDNNSLDYELTDHLGNVRALVSDKIYDFVATMETTPDGSMSVDPWFANVNASRVQQANLNVTEQQPGMGTPKYVSKLDGTTGKVIGPTIALKVKKGDKIKAHIYTRNKSTAT